MVALRVGAAGGDVVALRAGARVVGATLGRHGVSAGGVVGDRLGIGFWVDS